MKDLNLNHLSDASLQALFAAPMPAVITTIYYSKLHAG